MSKSLLYTVNSSAQNVNVDGVIVPGTVIRRFGPNLNLSGNAIQIAGNGYYKIGANFVISPTEAGDVTVTAYIDGVAVPGATASGTAAAANDFVTLSIGAVFRQACRCCEGITNLTFVVTGTASAVTNSAICVERI